MTIDGIIYVEGPINFNDKKNPIYYNGSGSIVALGNITFETDFLPNGNGSFPATNIVGFMTPSNISFGNSQRMVAGLFYAEGTITSPKQTAVAGTFFSNYFDMGTNVPSIFQVPTLADNLPYGMIGNYPILTLNRVAWRELGVTVEPAASPSS